MAYVTEWLTHLVIENAFLGHFSPQACVAVLEQTCPDYIDLHINLYRPIAEQALGLAMAGGDVYSLSFSAGEWERLKAFLRQAPPREREKKLFDGAEVIMRDFTMESNASKDYLRKTARDFLPRLNAALEER